MSTLIEYLLAIFAVVCYTGLSVVMMCLIGSWLQEDSEKYDQNNDEDDEDDKLQGGGALA